MSGLKLAFGFDFQDLYNTLSLENVDNEFLNYLLQEDKELHDALIAARKVGFLESVEYSNLIVNIAPFVEKFLAKMFGVVGQVEGSKIQYSNFEEIYKCKRNFVQRIALRDFRNHDWSAENPDVIESELIKQIGKFSELNYSQHVNKWLESKSEHEDELRVAGRFAAYIITQSGFDSKYGPSILFDFPKKIDPENLVDINVDKKDSVNIIHAQKKDVHYREGFSLTDKGPSLDRALDQANYCIYCHNREKDSCSKGLHEKPNTEDKYKKNHFGEDLAGCPLEEKISEMNFLKANGVAIGALVAATIDNPLLAATGHRICNDCMKSCIYQKQEPVNIPQIESRILTDVLQLDWGFEIYSLLTRWNPLHLKRPFPEKDSNKKILVVGLGPAGFNLSHHLLNDGHIICAIDGLKIEPLPENISGIKVNGERSNFEPIKKIDNLFEDLDNRSPGGFGGVAEYGITVRWNKNNLKVIRLLLERRKNFRMFGGTRFGSQITTESAKELGFDHVALASGAGKPNLLDIKNGFAKGVRTASDFLMGLQLTGAAREKSFANMQIRLPILVVGGGLTAIDTATESMAYYVRQVKKFKTRHEELISLHGVEEVTNTWGDLDKEIAEEFLEHAELFLEEDKKAFQEGRDSNYVKIIQELGGVNLIYRKRFIDAPCYRLNPEEVALALKEGIGFIEQTVPQEVIVDDNNAVSKLKVMSHGHEKLLAAKTIFLAIGTSPNTVAASEEGFELNGKYFSAVDNNNVKVQPQYSVKPETNFPFLNIEKDGFGISFFGDLHPSYAGNVVKAMASAKNGYPQITTLLKNKESNQNNIFEKLDNLLLAKIQQVNLLSDNIVEVVIHAPAAAENFKPGQFYRLQNYEVQALMSDDGSKLAMEGLAMTGAWVDKSKGLIAVIALEMGGSSDLCRFLKKGEHVILMGPTGQPTEIKSEEKVVLVGGGLGNAVLFSIGKAFRDAGSKVLYFAGYKKLKDLYKKSEIENAADQIVWCCDEGEIASDRAQDLSFHGNIVEAMEYYSNNINPNSVFELNAANRIIAIGSDRMMEAVHKARKNCLSNKFGEHKAVASINSPMQCMMKEICAQCIQRHVDPNTGMESYVYSCFNQDQDMDKVDFKHLNDRLNQNNLLEKQTKLWLNHNLKKIGLR